MLKIFYGKLQATNAINQYIILCTTRWNAWAYHAWYFLWRTKPWPFIKKRTAHGGPLFQSKNWMKVKCFYSIAANTSCWGFDDLSGCPVHFSFRSHHVIFFNFTLCLFLNQTFSESERLSYALVGRRTYASHRFWDAQIPAGSKVLNKTFRMPTYFAFVTMTVAYKTNM